jgi:hypothetical protein
LWDAFTYCTNRLSITSLISYSLIVRSGLLDFWLNNELRRCILIHVTIHFWENRNNLITFTRVNSLHIIILSYTLLLWRKLRQPNRCFLNTLCNRHKIVRISILLRRSHYLTKCSARMMVKLINKVLILWISKFWWTLHHLIILIACRIKLRGKLLIWIIKNKISIQRLHLLTNNWSIFWWCQYCCIW